MIPMCIVWKVLYLLFVISEIMKSNYGSFLLVILVINCVELKNLNLQQNKIIEMNCECVYFWKCEYGLQITDGVGLIDPRSNFEEVRYEFR